MVSAADVDKVIEPAVIKVSYWNNVFLFSPVFLLAAFYTYHSVSKSILNIIPLIIVLVIAIILIRQALVKKNNDVQIYADKDRLTIKKQTFQWKDLTNAYIMTENAGRTPDKFLLLELNGGDIIKISINQISVSGKRIAAIIEHYKTYDRSQS